MADSRKTLDEAIAAEAKAERNRARAENVYRAAWWATTDALAALPASPKADLTAAISAVATGVGQTREYVGHRRRIGKWFTDLAIGERATLPPRMAWVVVNENVDPHEAAELIHAAEANDLSLREFSQQLTGRPWTKAPESMTEAEQVHVARRVMAHPRMAEKVLDDDNAKAGTRRAVMNRNVREAGEWEEENTDGRSAVLGGAARRLRVEAFNDAVGACGRAQIAAEQIRGLIPQLDDEERAEVARHTSAIQGIYGLLTAALSDHDVDAELVAMLEAEQ